MRNLVDALPNHIADAISIGESAKLNPTNTLINNVCISGLGGSGIGGTIVSQLTATDATCPIVVNKDYAIPSFVSKNTLFVASSYSGNTEETLSALEKAQAAGAEIACITSGGKLLQIAQEKGYNYIEIPGGFPPRAAFGYSSVELFVLLTHYKIIDPKFLDQLKGVSDFLKAEQNDIQGLAGEYSKKLHTTIPILYAESSFEGVCVRFRQQINENAKMLAWHHVLPELNHNEQVGWAPDYPNNSVVLFRNETDFYRTQKRMEFTKGEVLKRAASFIEVWSKGDNILQRAYYLILLGDYISVCLAELKGIDPVEVDIITNLKNQLAEI